MDRNGDGSECCKYILNKNHFDRDFPGGPAVKTLHSQCRGPGFDPWSGN